MERAIRKDVPMESAMRKHKLSTETLRPHADRYELHSVRLCELET
jgi:hypothetical protein